MTATTQRKPRSDKGKPRTKTRSDKGKPRKPRTPKTEQAAAPTKTETTTQTTTTENIASTQMETPQQETAAEPKNDRKEFEDFFSSEVKTDKPPAETPTDNEFEDFGDDPEDEPPHVTQDEALDNALIFLQLIDEVRADTFSIFSGGNRKDYLTYNNLTKEDAIVKAGAKIVLKRQKVMSPEAIVTFSFLISSFFVYKTASEDRRENKRKREVEFRKRQRERDREREREQNQN